MLGGVNSLAQGFSNSACMSPRYGLPGLPVKMQVPEAIRMQMAANDMSTPWPGTLASCVRFTT